MSNSQVKINTSEGKLLKFSLLTCPAHNIPHLSYRQLLVPVLKWKNLESLLTLNFISNSTSSSSMHFVG